MDRKREFVIQRLSRIDNISTFTYVEENERFKGRPIGAMSIEAAIETYINSLQKENYYLNQDTFTKTPEDSEHKLAQQMIDYRAALKETRLHAKSEGNESTVQLNVCDEIQQKNNSVMSVYDRLDANRSSGFLLYSYDKKGMHSTLAEHRLSEACVGYMA